MGKDMNNKSSTTTTSPLLTLHDFSKRHILVFICIYYIRWKPPAHDELIPNKTIAENKRETSLRSLCFYLYIYISDALYSQSSSSSFSFSYKHNICYFTNVFVHYCINVVCSYQLQPIYLLIVWCTICLQWHSFVSFLKILKCNAHTFEYSASFAVLYRKLEINQVPLRYLIDKNSRAHQLSAAIRGRKKTK